LGRSVHFGTQCPAILGRSAVIHGSLQGRSRARHSGLDYDSLVADSGVQSRG
jgi:hypothetical protein